MNWQGKNSVRNYDKIDPGLYETRHERIPRESYLRDYWHPLICAAISRHCRAKVVLDLGCGTGTYTRLIAQYADLVLGLDISKVMLCYAKSKDSKLNLALADAYHIPLKAKSVDVVVCIGLFEYIERATVLEEISRALKSNGICIICCPNKYSAVRIPDKVVSTLLGREYFCKEPSYREMLKLFNQNGFKLIDSRISDGLIWLPDFLDRLVGQRIYSLIEQFFRLFGRNPFSNVMLFVIKKEKS